MKTLTDIVDECIADWTSQGATAPIELTSEDLAAITEELGRLPSQEEWRGAGYPGMPRRYVADEP